MDDGDSMSEQPAKLEYRTVEYTRRDVDAEWDKYSTAWWGTLDGDGDWIPVHCNGKGYIAIDWNNFMDCYAQLQEENKTLRGTA